MIFIHAGYDAGLVLLLLRLLIGLVLVTVMVLQPWILLSTYNHMRQEKVLDRFCESRAKALRKPG